MVLLLVSMVAMSLPVDPHANAKDLQAMQGKWSLAAGRADGRDLTEAMRNRIKMFVCADEMVLYTEDGRSSRLAFKVDAGVAPRTLDFNGVDGADRGKELAAIYELSGDRLKICRTLASKGARPGEYAAEAGSKRTVEEWQRDAAPFTAAEDMLRLQGKWKVVEADAQRYPRLRDLTWTRNLLTANLLKSETSIAFESSPVKVAETGQVTGAALGTFRYTFADGQLVIDFADGPYKGKWKLNKVREP